MFYYQDKFFDAELQISVLKQELIEKSKPVTIEIPVSIRHVAVRGNNPCNVTAIPGGWKGQVGKNKGIVAFETPEYGIRAAALVLLKYYYDYNRRTVRDILKRFCKSNRDEYEKFIQAKTGISAEQKITPKDFPALLSAMAHFESGHPWPEELFINLDVLKYERE